MRRNIQAARIMGTESPAEGASALIEAEPVDAAPEQSQPSRSKLAGTPDKLVEKFDDVQREMNELRDELNHLRRRDETLNFYMHRLDEELRLAARLQQDFLPKSLPELGGVRFHTLYRPAGYVSGDLYDVMRLDESHVGFYIADAVGHGMPAALLTMFIKHALTTKEIIRGGYRLLKPSEAMSRLNDALLEQHLAHATFATALYGMINVNTLELTMACAGHPAPELLSKDGTLCPIPVEGGLLGIFPDESYADFTTKLSPGDRLFLYTDGVEVSYCSDPAVGDSDRWRQELQKRFRLPTDEILEELANVADHESGSANPKDDLTMVVVDATSCK